VTTSAFKASSVAYGDTFPEGEGKFGSVSYDDSFPKGEG
jgi:hypothetical protein